MNVAIEVKLKFIMDLNEIIGLDIIGPSFVIGVPTDETDAEFWKLFTQNESSEKFIDGHIEYHHISNGGYTLSMTDENTYNFGFTHCSFSVNVLIKKTEKLQRKMDKFVKYCINVK